MIFISGDIYVPFRQINLHHCNTNLFCLQVCSLAGPSNLSCQECRLYQLVYLVISLNKIFIFYIYGFSGWMEFLYSVWCLLSFIRYILSCNLLLGYMQGTTDSSEERWDFLISTPRKHPGHIGACSVISAILFYGFVVGSSPKTR